VRKFAIKLGLLFTLASMVSSTEKKDLRPPPLNPHPKEALRIRVDFDRPEDAQRYTVTMGALYQNQRRECGYVDDLRGGHFVYPEGTFDIPNESHEPGRAEFTVYLDRFQPAACNWEFAGPNIHINDSQTRWFAFSGFGSRDNLIAGATYKATCEFIDSDPNLCWREAHDDRGRAIRVPITIRVSDDSAPLHPRTPGYFSHFLQPMALGERPGNEHDSSHD
jgi:hypothetical protein